MSANITYFRVNDNQDTRVTYTLANAFIKINDEDATPYEGLNMTSPGASILLSGELHDENDELVDLTIPINLKMPFVRHVNRQPVDEIYLSCSIQAGVVTVTGTIERSGDWKVLSERINQALAEVKLPFKLTLPDITFLA